MNHDSKSTEQLILEAAIQEFSEKGFKGARTTEIAARAGVTHAMLHYYFRTKQLLFEHIFREKVHYLIDLLVGALESPGENLRERVANGVSRHFDFIRANPSLPAFFVPTLTSNPELLQPAIATVHPKVRELVGRFQSEFDVAAARGEIAPVSVAMLLTDIISLNIFPFLMPKIPEMILKMDRDTFLDAKRAENIEIILKRITV